MSIKSALLGGRGRERRIRLITVANETYVIVTQLFDLDIEYHEYYDTLFYVDVWDCKPLTKMGREFQYSKSKRQDGKCLWIITAKNGQTKKEFKALNYISELGRKMKKVALGKEVAKALNTLQTVDFDGVRIMLYVGGEK